MIDLKSILEAGVAAVCLRPDGHCTLDTMPVSIDSHAHGYSRAADAYERGRPEYPTEAVDHTVRTLGIGPGKTVLDLAAGTGKFTSALVPTGASIIAIEPVAGMRERLAAKLPGVVTVDGIAEAIPLPNRSVDAVTVAQAFHWFRGLEALAEIRRVLKPGCGLALIWNVRDERVAWVEKLGDLMDPFGGSAPRHHTGKWREPFAVPNGFTSLQVERFHFTFSGTLEQAVDRVASTSFVAELEENVRSKLLDEVRHLFRNHPLTRSQATIDFPYITEVHRCFAT
jgi:ubiquinone/menaquinone biosynthesis C-methylase UbiE